MASADGRESTEARLAALEAQVRRLTDELAIYHITASYPAAVDSGSAAIASELWTEQGVYDVDNGYWGSREAIAGMVDGELHQSLIHEGCAHVISLPRVTVDGDQAVATCYSRLYRREGDGFVIWRVAANRWEYQRTPDGWRLRYRTNRLLDGKGDARALLRRAFDDPDEPLKTA